MTIIEQKLDDMLRKFERDAFYDDMRGIVKGAVEDFKAEDNAGIERIENKLAEMDNRQIKLRAEVLDLRKLMEDELGKINKALSLVLGVQDVSYSV